MTERAIIRKGDPTTHGGTVLEAFSTLSVYGKNVAGIGHRGYCPLCKRDFIIEAGAANYTYCGKKIALEGMHTSCGATLIATQWQATVDDTPRGNFSRDHAAKVFPVSSGVSSSADYDIQFIIRGDLSGKPLERIPYKLTLEDGSEIIGKTNADGLTEKIAASYPAIVTIVAPYYDESQYDDTDETDANCGCGSCLSESS